MGEDTGGDKKFLAWLADIATEPIVSGEMHSALSRIHAEMADLLEGMLQKDSSRRLCITSCLMHKWFDPIREKLLFDIRCSMERVEDDESVTTLLPDESGRLAPPAIEKNPRPPAGSAES